MVEMAGTAPACRKVPTVILPYVVDFRYIYTSRKLTKKYIRDDFETLFREITDKREKETYFLRPFLISFWKVKFVAGHLALIPKEGYTVERLGSNSNTRTLHKWREACERWCFCICILSFDNEADCPDTAHRQYESSYRILYHPQEY